MNSQYETNTDFNTEYYCSPFEKSSGFTPLMHAVFFRENLNVSPTYLAKRCLNISKILKKNPDMINVKNTKGWTALMLASRNSSKERGRSSIEFVKLLLEHKADVNIKTNDGKSALALASANASKERGSSSIETVKLLLEYGADIDIRANGGWTPLMVVCINTLKEKGGYSSIETVKLLLDYNANINLQDDNGWTPLMYSLIRERSPIEIFKLLLEYKPDVNIKERCSEWTALMLASSDYNSEFKTSSVEAVELLLKYGADVNAQNYRGNNALTLSTIDFKQVKEITIDYNISLKRDHFIPTLNEKECKIAELLIRGGAEIDYSRSLVSYHKVKTCEKINDELKKKYEIEIEKLKKEKEFLELQLSLVPSIGDPFYEGGELYKKVKERFENKNY